MADRRAHSQPQGYFCDRANPVLAGPRDHELGASMNGLPSASWIASQKAKSGVWRPSSPPCRTCCVIPQSQNGDTNRPCFVNTNGTFSFSALAAPAENREWHLLYTCNTCTADRRVGNNTGRVWLSAAVLFSQLRLAVWAFRCEAGTEYGAHVCSALYCDRLRSDN